MSYIIASTTLSIPGMILSETALSFIGLGLRAPAISWGVLLQEAQNVAPVRHGAVAILAGGGGDPGSPGLQFPGRRLARRRRSLFAITRRWIVEKTMQTDTDRGQRPQDLFYLDEGLVKAVDGADFTIQRGKTIGIVGESGCGKSVTLVRLCASWRNRPKSWMGRSSSTARPAAGPVMVMDLAALDLTADNSEMRSIRGAEISMIFQEPMTSLSPVHTIGNQISEVITLHQKVIKKRGASWPSICCDQVGMPQPARRVDATHSSSRAACASAR